MGSCGGSVGKLVCLNDAINSDPSINASRPFPFLLLDGVIADFTPWMQSGGHGTVSGIPNFAPAATMRLWDLLNTPSLTDEEKAERQRIQLILARADAYAMPAGIRGMSMNPSPPRLSPLCLAYNLDSLTSSRCRVRPESPPRIRRSTQAAAFAARDEARRISDEGI